MTSIERIMEYTNLKSEPLNEFKKKPPKEWPSKGQITFHNVSLSYDKHLPNVLKNVTANISASEKIGIVGRTGAGKSSFFQTIFRMYEPSGSIVIDGFNIQDLSLKDLRSKLTIIPVLLIFF
jgi:ATP-binding cassette subfamily C (CFTR/MRP) protein 4